MRITSYAFGPLALLVSVGVFAACTVDATVSGNDVDSGAPNTETPNDAGSTVPDGGCATGGGSGSIVVNVTGLPAGVTTKIDLQGKNAEVSSITGAQTVSTAEDEYKVSAQLAVSTGDTTVRTVYTPTIDVTDFCVAASGTATVNVTYTALPTSNKLWLTNDSTAQVLAYGASSLTATGAPAATTSVTGGAGKAIAFDNLGNLWTLGATTTDPAIQRYPASQLGTSGAKTPDISITYDPGCQPGTTGMTFDSTGGLWVSSSCGQKVVHFAASSLHASGSPTPDMTIGSLTGPEGIAFDASGNLWVADPSANTLSRFDASRLTATGANAAADAVITAQTEAAVNIAENWIAFDKAGALWAIDVTGYHAYKLPSPDLTGTGTRTVVPSVILTLPVDELPEGIALDESGNLWFPLSAGKVGALTVSQLATTATVTPSVIITSTDIGSAASLAFYPGATGTPLYSATLGTLIPTAH